MSRELNSLLGKTRHENFDSEACKQGRVAVNVLLFWLVFSVNVTELPMHAACISWMHVFVGSVFNK